MVLRTPGQAEQCGHTSLDNHPPSSFRAITTQVPASSPEPSFSIGPPRPPHAPPSHSDISHSQGSRSSTSSTNTSDLHTTIHGQWETMLFYILGPFLTLVNGLIYLLCFPFFHLVPEVIITQLFHVCAALLTHTKRWGLMLNGHKRTAEVVTVA